MSFRRLLFIPLCAGPLFAQAFRPDAIALEWSTSDAKRTDVSLARISLQKQWKRQWFTEGAWQVTGYWDASLAVWRNQSRNRTHSSLIDLGLTPTLRLEQTQPSGLAPYVEGGVGIHVLSHTSVSRFRRFGSAFQFGEHIGFGIRPGAGQSWDISYRFQHLSNAGLQTPNKGINFHGIRLSHHF